MNVPLKVQKNLLVGFAHISYHVIINCTYYDILASLPRMHERTITISSASKTFAIGGWKVGWAYGPTKLMNDLKKVQSCVHGGCSTPIQVSLSSILSKYK